MQIRLEFSRKTAERELQTRRKKQHESLHGASAMDQRWLFLTAMIRQEEAPLRTEISFFSWWHIGRRAPHTDI